MGEVRLSVREKIHHDQLQLLLLCTEREREREREKLRGLSNK